MRFGGKPDPMQAKELVRREMDVLQHNTDTHYVCLIRLIIKAIRCFQKDIIKMKNV